MRFVHVACVLLATAICCNAAAVQGDAKSTNQQAVDTVNKTTVAKNSTIPLVVPANASATVANATKNTIDSTTTVASATTISTNVNGNKDNVTLTNEQSTSTASPTISTTATATSAPTTLSTTTKKTPDDCTTTTGTSTTTTTTTTVTTPTTSNASVSSTTSVPVSTKVAPPSPYKERHFDGLSFLGGIILATCLMAIGVLSWKFYKTFNEQNYRTL